MPEIKVALRSPAFTGFFDQNGDFDLLTHDFFDPEARQRLTGAPGDLEERIEALKPFQRLLRLLPGEIIAAHATEAAGQSRAERIMAGLIAHGYDSAHQIATASPLRFEQECADVFEGDAGLAHEVRRRAVQVTAATRHVFANARALAASPFDRSSVVQYASQAVAEYFQGIPSYQSLFGSLDYIEVPHDASIFGPAAYLLDILRITEEYISYYNRATIPPGFTLRDRRPDLLSHIKLDAAATSAAVPYVTLVNEIMEHRLAVKPGGDPFQTLALAPYPFNLPFNRPWAETATYLVKAGTSLLAIGQAMRGRSRPDLVTVALSLSPEQSEELRAVNTSDQAIGAQYGMADISKGLPSAGPGAIALEKGKNTAAGVGVNLKDVLAVGQLLEAEGQTRTVTKIEVTGEIHVDVAWVSSSAGAGYTVYGFPTNLANASAFRGIAGEMNFQQLQELLTQGLSETELKAKDANAFFINDTNEGLDPMAQVQGDASLGNVQPLLTPLSRKRLDRLSRFVRLVRWCDVDPAAADWLLRISAAQEITPDFLWVLDATRRLAELLGVDLAIAAAMAGPFKTSGRGDGATPADPFDRVFNSPALLKEANPYTAANPIAFDPARPLTWAPETLTGPGITGKPHATSELTITLAAEAPTAPGYFNGFQIAIVKGLGAGQERIIKSYSGASREATLYEKWVTIPDGQSEYTISNATDLVDRLAVALSTRLTELSTLGDYYKAAICPSAPGIVLDLTALTGLWRLSWMARAWKLSVAEYLVVRRLAGLTGIFVPGAVAALSDAERAIAMIEWLRARNLSAYDLDYIENGTVSRFVRPAFTREQTGGILQDLASASVGVRLTASTLIEAGFDRIVSAQLVEDLETLGILDGDGLVLPHDALFSNNSAAFPITKARLTSLDLSAKEADAVAATLSALRPQYLKPANGAWDLTASYPPGSSLEFLCASLPDASTKQARIGALLDGVAAQTEFQIVSPLLPFQSATAFVTEDIGGPQSELVFERLSSEQLAPRVLIGSQDSPVAYLSASYDGSAKGWNLFTSPATGQSGQVAGYSGADRLVTMAGAWSPKPDAFAYYEIVKTMDSGTSQGSGEAEIVLAQSATSKDGAYVGDEVVIKSGPGADERRLIIAYEGASRLARVNAAWKAKPDQNSAYAVERGVARGNVQAATDNTVHLDAQASNVDAAYDGMTLRLVPDPDANGKTTEVVAALGTRRAEVVNLAAVVASTQALQWAAVSGACASTLNISVEQALVGLIYVDADPRLRRLIPYFLGGDTTANREEAGRVLDQLARFALARTQIGLQDPVWRSLARQPWLYNLDFSKPLDRGNLTRESGLAAVARQNGADSGAISDYLEIWTDVVGEDAKLDALQNALGWDAEDTRALDAYLIHSGTAPQQSPYNLDGLERLSPAFEIIFKTSANAAFLVQIADRIAAPPLGPIGGSPDAPGWAASTAAAEAALGALAVRYGDNAFSGIADELNRSVAVMKRDALMGYLIWTLRNIPQTGSIRTPADLLEYLLIDVEQSGCDTTSPVAQGIASVQLYMQRCRMGLEPGVTVDHIPEVWWSWMSTYRVWEANRKIFLYPENYLAPASRRSASPEFRQLESDLLQGRPDDANVAKSLSKYFNTFEQLAGIVPVGACKKDQQMLEGGQIDETTIIVGRTNTSPYAYYTREFTRSIVPETALIAGSTRQVEDWRPWTSVDVKAGAPYVTPVWVFDRLFVFWNEVTESKSSTITSANSNTASSTQSIWNIASRYTFQTTTGEWLSPQSLGEATILRVAPNDYVPANNNNVKAAYAPIQHYWSQPLALALPRGLPGTGALSFAKGSKTATGTGTRLEGQVAPGDFIMANGQRLQVDAVDPVNQTLTLGSAFLTNGDNTPFNVLPKDPQRTRYAPFPGPGLANVLDDFNIVNGDAETRFTVDFTVGDYIEVEGLIRTVKSIVNDKQMIVTENWTITTPVPGKPYKIIPRADGGEKLLAFFGPNLDLDTNYGDAPPNPQKKNDGGDPFISAGNAFNTNLYDGINLISVVKNKPGIPKKGDITGHQSTLLSANLDRRDIRAFSPFYSGTESQTSPLIRAAIDRENQLLYVEHAERPLVSLYWGNGVPGTTANQRHVTGADRILLYHIDPGTAALMAVTNQIGWSILNTDIDALLVTVNNRAPVEAGAGVVLKTFALTPVQSDDGTSSQATVDKLITFGPYSLENVGFAEQTYQVARLNTSVGQTLKQRLYAGFDQLLSLDSQSLPESPFNQYYQTPSGDPPPPLDRGHLPSPVMDFDGSYGPYFWEVFYHAPTLIADWLSASQDYERAKAWYEYVFNPMASSDPLGATGSERYWRFRPFRENMDIPSLQAILTNTFEINRYNSDPFDPNAIARLRISAYAKYSVLQYVANLIRWADALFTQDTRESIAQATNLYLLARDLLGKKPEVVGEFRQRDPLTYDEIKAHYPQGGIPQFLIDLENTPFVFGGASGSGYADVPINDIRAYFGVPDNAELATHWATIDDRLYKIRNCMNINGVVRTLALFAPPINPASLIGGPGAGGGVAGGAFNVPYPIPNYRFSYLLSMARSMTLQVQRLGSGLLAALERKDADALAQLQLTGEAQLLNLGTQIKEMTISQIVNQIEGLKQALAGAQARQTHYGDLIDEGLLPTEIAQEVTLTLSATFKAASGVLGAAASVSAAFPNVGSPFAMTYGGQQLGASLQNLSGWSSALATVLDTATQILAIEANQARRVQDWELQKTLAGFDVAQFDAQIAAAQVQLEIAQRDLQIQNAQIEQNRRIQDFYKSKFTNERLYSWMAGKLATAYFQAYGLALELARMAQRSYQFERRTEAAFIAGTYWDDLYRGLTAGEQLDQALSQLETASIRTGSRGQNITKVVSLRSLDPVAFLRFIATGETYFDLPERIFDEDFPGQYRRRIVSLKVSLPALVGPYRNIHATLTQTANRVVLQPELDAVKFLLGEDVEVKAGVIEHNARAYQKISLSKGQGDSGVFNPEPSDLLYLPFEQTGAVSSWRLSMPKPANPISFEAISDVIIEIQYSASDGGDHFAQQVADLPALRERQWTELLEPALQYQPEWSAFMTGAVTGERQTLRFMVRRIVPPNITQPESVGVLVRLVAPEGTPLQAKHPFIALSIGGSDPVDLLPAADGVAYSLFDQPAAIGAGDAEVIATFDLRPGYTPPSLRDAAGKRLDPAVLRDVQIVAFLSGRAQDSSTADFTQKQRRPRCLLKHA